MDYRERGVIINESLGEFISVMMWRRKMHSHPELSFSEHHTAKFIADALRAEGIEFQSVAGTGVLARIVGKVGDKAKRAVVLRADIDALPIVETTGVEYASVNKGVMHACGHDMHAAMLLGALRILKRHSNALSGTVFGLFQPGEERNPGGASLVMKENPFEGYDIAAFIGQHVEPGMKTGTFGFRRGRYMAANDELRFTVNGVGGHAALRDKLKDPVQAAVAFLSKLYGIPALSPLPELPTIISIGKVTADGATNVVPDSIYMEGTMRTFDEEWRARIKTLINEYAVQTNAAFGVSVDVDISSGYPCVYNDEKLTAEVEEATRRIFGNDAVAELGLRPTSEDFGYYTQQYPSVFFRLGVGGDGEFFEKGSAGRIHTSRFAPDEKAMGYGVVQLVNITIEILGNDNK